MHTLGLDFSTIIPLAAQWGYLGAAGALFVEGLSIPFPGGTFLLFYGFLASQGKISLPLAIISASLGYTLAGTFPYWVGKIGGRPLLLRFGPYIGFSHRYFQKTEAWFNRFGNHLVAYGRLMFFRNYISYFAGMTKMPPLRFYVLTWLGILPWVIYMTLLGYLLGNNWRYALTFLEKYSWAGGVAVALVIGIFYLAYRAQVHKILNRWVKIRSN